MMQAEQTPVSPPRIFFTYHLSSLIRISDLEFLLSALACSASWYLENTNSNCLFVPFSKNCALFDAIVADCIRLQSLPTNQLVLVRGGWLALLYCPARLLSPNWLYRAASCSSASWLSQVVPASSGEISSQPFPATARCVPRLLAENCLDVGVIGWGREAATFVTPCVLCQTTWFRKHYDLVCNLQVSEVAI